MKILNKRYKYEKKWAGFRCFIRGLTIFSGIAIIISLYRFFSKIGNSAVNMISVVFFATIGLLVPFFLKMIVRSMVSSWVTDIFNEKLEIRDNIIYREYSLSLGAGYMNLIEGYDRVIMMTRLSDIHNLKICEKTGRIQFHADTSIMYYSDWKNKILEQNYEKKDFLNVYYDYFEPSFMKYLKETGIPYLEGDMKFEKGK